MGKAVVVSLLLLACAPAMAQTSERLQNNDLALTGGGQFAFSNPLDLGAAWALEGAFAHALMSVPLVSLSAELPVAGSFTSSPPTLNGFRVARSYNALFITPGVRLRLAPSFPLSPYLSAGIGYARFDRQYFDGTTSPSSTMAFDIGGGLDLKVFPFVSLRGEIRDFNSGGVGLQSLVLGRQNNVFVTFGLALRF
jgi:Outer membrane protein beta-barrel domain